MLNRIKKAIMGWLAPAAKEPAPPARDTTVPRSRRRKKSPGAPEPVGTAAPQRNPNPPSGGFPPPKKFRAPKPEKPAAAPRGDAPKRAPKPKMPETLRDIPAAEGKTRFLDLPLHERVQFGLQNIGFEYCTPIQALALPPLLEGRDLAGKAQTGTGKTAAFLASSFTWLLNRPIAGERRNGEPRMLVLAPTRELAIQIHKDAEAVGVFTGLVCEVVFGGMDHEKQRRNLERPVDVIIGTPGRIIDYSRNGDLRLGKVEILVIDEADRMLDMGFIPDVKRIVGKLPPRGERRTQMFSATLDPSILRLASGWLIDPITVESEPDKLVSENIEQIFYAVSRDEKLALMLHFIRHTEFHRMLVFGNRKDVNLRLQRDLARYGVAAPILSGDIPQEKRLRILEKFRTGEVKVVIATDVAARGIHVDDVSVVINYDLPEHPEDYVHRIGRTGRAGHTGKAISFLCEYGAYYLDPIEKMLDTRFPSLQPDEEMLTLPPPVPVSERPEVDRAPLDRHGRGGSGGGPRDRRPRRR